MPIYKVTRNDDVCECGGQYMAFVCVAQDAVEASRTHPDNLCWDEDINCWTAGKGDTYVVYGVRDGLWLDPHWCQPCETTVEEIQPVATSRVILTDMCDYSG